MIDRHDITGLVLAGGRGSRMGGVDKGLQSLEGKPLVAHALARLAPQVGSLMINANRNAEAYAAFGVPVLPDADGEFSGPLSGFLSGLSHCPTEWLVTVPCDSPRLPSDLVERFAVEIGSSLAAIAVTEEQGARQRQPVFCLLHRSLQDALSDYLAGGGRKIDRWLDSVGCAGVFFEDSGAFFNANTLEELRQLGTK